MNLHVSNENQAKDWPPKFTLDQEAILNLLTGDRFYSNPSAALREAILNAIDAVHRRHRAERNLVSTIEAVFNRDELSLSISDNGVGMSQEDVSVLFTKVGTSAAAAEAEKDAVGEFGIGVVSYFMAADSFELQTYDGESAAIGLGFDRSMLAGGMSTIIPAVRVSRGTTVVLHLRDQRTFELMLESYNHWCRDVEGLSAQLLPEHREIPQGIAGRARDYISVTHPDWVERAHLGPVAEPTGWDSMTGTSTVSVLYRGVFVQDFEIRGLWGIQGSIDVDPKHFKPKLNREGFISGEFQSEVEGFLRQSHPAILEAMAKRLRAAAEAGELDKWTEKRWANLWLSVPRDKNYAAAIDAWDSVFRSLPAFEVAVGNKWEPASLEYLLKAEGTIYVAPLADETQTDVVKAAVRLLRNSKATVIRGIRKDRTWMRFVGSSFGTTADLIANVFRDDLPPLLPVAQEADSILQGLKRLAPLFTGPPKIDLVSLGIDGPPALRLAEKLVINVDHSAGKAIVEEVLRTNAGAASLIGIAARHAYEQLSQVAAVARETSGGAEILSPVRRRYIRKCLP